MRTSNIFLIGIRLVGILLIGQSIPGIPVHLASALLSFHQNFSCQSLLILFGPVLGIAFGFWLLLGNFEWLERKVLLENQVWKQSV